MRIAATGALEAGPDSSILYRGAYTDILSRMKNDGFDAAELHILDSREIDREALWRDLKGLDMVLTSVGTGSVYGARGYNLVGKDPDVRKKAIAHLEEHMITLSPFGGVLIVGLIAGRAWDAEAPLDVQKERLAESLRELDRLAGKHAVTVGLEMMNRYECDFLHTIGEGIAFLDACGSLKNTAIHIDTVSMNISERDIGAAIRAGRGRICHVHLADNDRWYPGHAHYDFRETLQALKDIGYDGALALEMKMHPDTRTAARLSLRYLNAVLSILC